MLRCAHPTALIARFRTDRHPYKRAQNEVSEQPDPGQAAGHHVAEERQPARTVLGGGDLHPEDLPVAFGVDPDSDQRAHAHDPAVLADLEHQRIGGNNVYGPASSGRCENASTASSSSAAITDTWDLERPVTPRDSTSCSIRRVDIPSR